MSRRCSIIVKWAAGHAHELESRAPFDARTGRPRLVPRVPSVGHSAPCNARAVRYECAKPSRAPAATGSRARDRRRCRGVRPDGDGIISWVLPEPLRGGHTAGLRGLGGAVPVLRAVRRGAARGGREALLVLELDALPAADARVRRDLHRHRLPGARLVAEPGLRRPAGDGDRLSLHQRLHLHLGQPGHGPGEDRRARRALPAARGLLLRALGRAVRGVAHEDGGADRGARGAGGAAAARARARRGRVRGPGDELLRRPRRVPPRPCGSPT